LIETELSGLFLSTMGQKHFSKADNLWPSSAFDRIRNRGSRRERFHRSYDTVSHRPDENRTNSCGKVKHV